MTVGADQDVVFVTIDCWRHDALDWMPNLRERITRAGYTRGEAICQSSCTRGSVPAILASQYYPQVYRAFDEIDSTVESLASILSDAGYATGGFVGSNPFLTNWGRGFDHFWNDGLDVEPESSTRERLRSVASKVRHAANYLLMRGQVPAEDVASLARDWYDARESPRFLWMHLMDVHPPYLPGTRRSLEVGPLSVCSSHWRFSRDPNQLSAADRRTLRTCYRKSLAYLDARFPRVVDFVDDDALVVVVADHGEEFEHGEVGHVHLYDETVRVPLITKGLPAVDDGDVVRQLDLPATVLAHLDLPIPDDWEGRPYGGTYRDTFMLNHSPRMGRVYAGIRTDRLKLIRTSDVESGEVVGREAYDLGADPAETSDIYASGNVTDLERRLRAFLTREDIESNLLEHPRENLSVVVEERLKALGYG